MPASGLALTLFLATYLLLALGRLRGLAIDRTGFALLGAVAFLATGEISLDAAKESIDVPTLAVLFGMMLLSAQYELSGLYGRIAAGIARAGHPRRLLAGTLGVSALLAAVLTNDVVCFALTPLVGAAVLEAGLEPLPYFLAIACGTNLGSAATPIGNPQIILIAQQMHLAFLPFVAFCAPAVALSLAAAYLLLAGRIRPLAASAPAPAIDATPFDRGAARKALLLTIAAIALFLSPFPAPLTALGVAGVVP